MCILVRCQASHMYVIIFNPYDTMRLIPLSTFYRSGWGNVNNWSIVTQPTNGGRGIWTQDWLALKTTILHNPPHVSSSLDKMSTVLRENQGLRQSAVFLIKLFFHHAGEYALTGPFWLPTHPYNAWADPHTLTLLPCGILFSWMLSVCPSLLISSLDIYICWG